jgi:methyl-accepting chemotaxis protein
MQVKSSMKIVSKLYLILLITLGSMLLGLIFTNLLMRHINSDFGKYAETTKSVSHSINEVYALAAQSELSTRNFLLNPSDDQAYKNYQKAVTDFEATLAKAEGASTQIPEIGDKLKNIRPVWQEGRVLKEQVISLAKAGKQAEASDLLINSETKKWRELKAAIIDGQKASSGYLDSQHSSMNAFIDKSTRTSVILSAVVMGFVAILMIGVVTMMKRELNRLLTKVREIAEGKIDLTNKIKIDRNDEIGEIGILINTFISRLHDIVARVTEDTVKLSGSAGQLFQNAQRMSIAVDRSALQASTVATASEEMAATACDIARNCCMAAESAGEANNNANLGASVIMETVNVMSEVAGAVQQSSQSVSRLGEQSDQIGAIVGTIEDIADQTNLLALNAAIEAARAGEQGRGFAVVADEVRALAERTTRATKEISAMIKSIQAETTGAVHTMGVSEKNVDRGIGEAGRSADTLISIIDSINGVTTQVSQIATAAEEQTATTNEINQNICAINDNISESSRITREVADESNNLGKLAEGLQESVTEFRTHSSDVLILEIAKNDHRLFVNRIKAAVEGYLDIDPTTLATHHTCRFGKWYDNLGEDMCGQLASFKAIIPPHEAVHRVAKDALVAAGNGETAKAHQMIREMEGYSHKIVDLLIETRQGVDSAR